MVDGERVNWLANLNAYTPDSGIVPFLGSGQTMQIVFIEREWPRCPSGVIGLNGARCIGRVSRGDPGESVQFIDVNGSEVTFSEKTFNYAEQAISNLQFGCEGNMALIGMVSRVDDGRRDDTFLVDAGLHQHAARLGFSNGSTEILFSSEGCHLEANDGPGANAAFFYRHVAELRWKDARMSVEVVGKNGISTVRRNR
jgi:hypothetical protein